MGEHMTLDMFNAVVTRTETERLETLERVIERGLQTFVDVGVALREIRDSRLYRATHDTFEDYCQERWGWARRYAYYMIDAATAAQNVHNCAQIAGPANEAQARPLTRLEPDQQREAWREAVETAPDGKVTGAHVERVVERYRDPVTAQRVETTVFSSRSEEYYTPAEYIEAARDVMGGIDLDPASCDMAQQTVKAGAFFTKEMDGLARPWFGRVFLNPPYGTTSGESNQGIWATRLIEEYECQRVEAGILLVKAALGYEWFESLWYDWPVCFPRQRLSFSMPDGSSDGQSKQGSALFYFGNDIERFTGVFRAFGRVIMPEKD